MFDILKWPDVAGRSVIKIFTAAYAFLSGHEQTMQILMKAE